MLAEPNCATLYDQSSDTTKPCLKRPTYGLGATMVQFSCSTVQTVRDLQPGRPSSVWFGSIAQCEHGIRETLSFNTGTQARANDPSRLQNRGGKLLMEQRAQRQLMKQFPKVKNGYNYCIDTFIPIRLKNK